MLNNGNRNKTITFYILTNMLILLFTCSLIHYTTTFLPMREARFIIVVWYQIYINTLGIVFWYTFIKDNKNK